MRWDLFCRVVDNFGDIGVCWRLARHLAAAGDGVRLFVDDASALAWMAPAGAAGVEVLDWSAAEGAVPAGFVVEAFGCDPPATFVAAMRAAARPPVWINLEYLSAEGYVERSHRLPSPQLSGPGQGLTKWFFYPGFGDRTGGLLREPGLLAARQAFDGAARSCWMADHGIAAQADERLVSLFCYDNPQLPALLHGLGAAPTLLLAAPGAAQRALRQCDLPAGVRWQAMHYLDHDDFDRLLWSCDLNIVRGEDSLVRALWAGKPLLWQLYPQHDGAHNAKLEAFLGRWADGAGADGPPTAVADLMRAWNGIVTGSTALPAMPDFSPRSAWSRAGLAWRDRLGSHPGLALALRTFALGKAGSSC